MVRPDDLVLLETWARAWHHNVSAAFLRAYLAATAATPALVSPREELKPLLDTFVLDKAVYELGYEMQNRPDWVRIPLLGILGILDAAN
jgi:maltose alpha-D-glucosyltransferase/alpha-amylase